MVICGCRFAQVMKRVRRSATIRAVSGNDASELRKLVTLV
jgi:hypothetical protein